MRSSWLFLLLFVLACKQPPAVHEIQLSDIEGNSTTINPDENHLTVIYFLSPECLLCLNYTLAFKQIQSQFKSDFIRFFGIHSGRWFSPKEVEDYALKYDLEMKMLLDDQNQMANALGATVTPEVFVLNSNAEVLYSGKIDNWVNDLGKKKLEVSEHYLKDALSDILANKPVETARTEPVGCLIE